MRGLILGLLLGLSACGSAPLIGRTCKDPNSCAGSMTAACFTDWPEGYCTEYACSAGSCPSGSRCATGLQFPSVPFTSFCLATCAKNDDCRARYVCADIQAPEKVCVPENPS